MEVRNIVSTQDRECMATRTEYFFSDYSQEPKLSRLRPLLEFDEINCHSEIQARLVTAWLNDNGFKARRLKTRVVSMVKVN